MTHSHQSSNYWPTGKELTGGYRVAGHLGQGGMETVYLVERRISLNTVQYAVKTLIPDISENAVRRRNFLSELRTWIDLPDHPNLVACRFFRTMDNTLAIFSEYVHGRSLDKWIQQNSGTSLETLLSIAIQIARGLQCAHVSGVIHQDIKPSNILISDDAIAKITDFGLARNRLHGMPPVTPSDSWETLVISSRGMTMPYCSLEQAMGRKISRKTDMWSFGLTLLDMFNGGLSWRLGSAAAQTLVTYLRNGPIRAMPEMPDGVTAIIHRCFEDDPSNRWRDMDEVGDLLLEQYRIHVGQPFPFPRPEIPVDNQPESIVTDRSTFTGADWMEPIELYQMALTLAGKMHLFDENNIPPLTQTTQRARALRDIEIYDMAETIYREMIKDGDIRDQVRMNLGEILFNRALATEACQDMAHSAQLYEEAFNILDGVDMEYARGLRPRCKMNGSGCLYFAGDSVKAHQWFDEAIEGFRSLVATQFLNRWVRNLAICLMNKASILTYENKPVEALKHLNEAFSVCEELLQKDNINPNWCLLASILTNIGMTYYSLKQDEAAMDAINQAIDIFQLELERTNSYEAVSSLGINNFFKVKILLRRHKPVEAEVLIQDSIVFLKQQIKNGKREDLRSHYAEFLETLAELYCVQGRNDDALNLIDEAVTILEQIVVKEDQNQHLALFGQIALKAMVMNYAVGDKTKARRQGMDTLALWLRIAKEHEWNPDETRKSIDKALSEFLSDLEYANRESVATEIRRAIHTMGKKFRATI